MAENYSVWLSFKLMDFQVFIPEINSTTHKKQQENFSFREFYK